MTMIDRDTAAATGRVLRSREEVEAHIRAICFKTGPPARLGAELEWTLHHTAAPAAPLDTEHVRRTLGPLAPATLGPPAPDPPAPPDALPAGGGVTLEPGGQIEISSAPASSLADLHRAVSTDLTHLGAVLAAGGLALGGSGIDEHRAPARLLDTPRYRAMEHGFAARGPDGRVMMCSTAGLQVCLDAGTPGEVPLRWAAALALGPPLIALFANSTVHAGRDTGLASARMAAWWSMDPRLTHPPTGPAGDPAAGWIRYALDAPVLCVRSGGGCWDPPAGLTLGAWVRGALPRPPTTDDIDYHLSLLFPPVRPRGYLEIRYLDAQPGPEWIVPVALVAALFDDPATTGAALEAAGPVAGSWADAYRHGLADRALHRTATALAALAAPALARSGLDAGLRAHVLDSVHRRLHTAAREETSR